MKVEGRQKAWKMPPAGVKSTDCTMSAPVYASDAPGGDDYMDMLA